MSAMYTHTIESYSPQDDGSVILNCVSRRKPGVTCSSDSIYLNEKDQEFVVEKLGLYGIDSLVAYTFPSKHKEFDDAFRHHVWGREVSNVVTELIIPALLVKKNPSTRGVDYKFLNDWWMNEDRVESIKPDRIYLTAVPFYKYLNTLLPETIRITEMDPTDARINSRAKGQAGYFHLEHPQGDCYGFLFGGQEIFKLYEFSQ